MKTFPWDENSVRRLTELAPKCGPTEIARILAKEFGSPLSADAVRAKKDNLHLGIGQRSSPWTPEKSELATKMWAQGASAGRIAKEIGGGISRNSVLSKMRRTEVDRPKTLSLPPKMRKKTAIEAGLAASIARKANEARKASKPGPLAAGLPMVYAGPPNGGFGPDGLEPRKWDARPLPDSRPALLVNLRNHRCRWPLEEQDGIRGRFLMCGAPRVNDKCPYCMLHWRRSRAAA